MNKLSELISEAIEPNEFVEPSLIAHRINRKHEEVRVTKNQIKDFLNNEYYPEEEARQMERKFRGFNGSYYI